MGFENEGKQLAFDIAEEEETVESTRRKWSWAKQQAEEFICPVAQQTSPL